MRGVLIDLLHPAIIIQIKKKREKYEYPGGDLADFRK
jgi:hypothetical protein